MFKTPVTYFLNINSLLVNPHKARSSYEKLSAQLRLPEEDLRAINSFYWKTIRTHLSDLSAPQVLLVGLGDMKIKPWRVDGKISDLVHKAKKWSTINAIGPVHESYHKDLMKVQELKEMIQFNREHRQDIKTKRETYAT